MKSVLLRITGKQYTDEKEEDVPIEFITEGRCLEENGACTLIYDETELSGMQGCTTSVEIRPGRVNMTRSGALVPMDTIMDFEEGVRHTGLYQTAYGPIQMEVLTNSIEDHLTRDVLSGIIRIDYHIVLKGLGEAHNVLDIEILEDKGELPN